MASTKFTIVYTTIPTRAVATKIARKLITEKLVACANIVGPTVSIYPWKGSIDETKEFIVILKTTKALYSKVSKKIVEMHPYECPCVVQIDINSVHATYGKWLHDSVLKI